MSPREPKKTSRAQQTARAKAPPEVQDITWIRTLAAPYLRGYRPASVTEGPLRGYRFIARRKAGANSAAGFFVGYLLNPEGHEFLKPDPPECLVYAFVEPVDSAFYRRMVTANGSLLRWTTEYIGWLTHRPPRFALFDGERAVLVRHCPMREWPPRKIQHISRNFFIESLAWLVRSGLVSKLAGTASAPGKPRNFRKQKV